MENQYAQVHDLPKGYQNPEYTYESVIPWMDLSRVAIYLLCFAGFFMLARALFRAF